MKKIIVFFTVACIFASSFNCWALTAAPEISAGAAVLMHADTGEIIYEKNADSAMLIASTTKVMTALVVLENCKTDEKVEVTWDHASIEGSSMYLKPGGDYTVEQLLYGMLLASGNDAAAALACHTAGSIEAFADMMNDKARELGLKNSSFKNPHGLDEDGHYSCAEDLARIMAEALKNDLFCEIIGTGSYTVDENTYINHNKLLWSCEGMLGGKTGYTMAAGRTLVTACRRNDMTLICVTIGAPDDWNDHSKMYEWAYEEYYFKNALPDGKMLRVPVISGEADSVSVCPETDIGAVCTDGDELTVKADLPRFVYAAVQAGEEAGQVRIYKNGRFVGSCRLVYGETVRIDAEQEMNTAERLLRLWTAVYGGSYVLTGD